ncbi:hypothetical protein KCP75_16255 [Salmonella enterica subsp. enterica]|nr:hypothetical protein KCP75_16255 [Salmonella enterica subsp. enterica]
MLGGAGRKIADYSPYSAVTFRLQHSYLGRNTVIATLRDVLETLGT